MVLVVGVVARVTKDSVDGGHRGNGGRVTDSSSQQLLPDLPGEHPRMVRLDADDSLHHAGSRHLLNKPARAALRYSFAKGGVHGGAIERTKLSTRDFIFDKIFVAFGMFREKKHSIKSPYLNGLIY